MLWLRLLRCGGGFGDPNSQHLTTQTPSSCAVSSSALAIDNVNPTTPSQLDHLCAPVMELLASHLHRCKLFLICKLIPTSSSLNDMETQQDVRDILARVVRMESTLCSQAHAQQTQLNAVSVSTGNCKSVSICDHCAAVASTAHGCTCMVTSKSTYGTCCCARFDAGQKGGFRFLLRIASYV